MRVRASGGSTLCDSPGSRILCARCARPCAPVYGPRSGRCADAPHDIGGGRRCQCGVRRVAGMGSRPVAEAGCPLFGRDGARSERPSRAGLGPFGGLGPSRKRLRALVPSARGALGLSALRGRFAVPLRAALPQIEELLTPTSVDRCPLPPQFPLVFASELVGSLSMSCGLTLSCFRMMFGRSPCVGRAQDRGQSMAWSGRRMLPSCCPRVVSDGASYVVDFCRTAAAACGQEAGVGHKRPAARWPARRPVAIVQRRRPRVDAIGRLACEDIDVRAAPLESGVMAAPPDASGRSDVWCEMCVLSIARPLRGHLASFVLLVAGPTS